MLLDRFEKKVRCFLVVHHGLQQWRHQFEIFPEEVLDGRAVRQLVEDQFADVVQVRLDMIDVAGDVVQGEAERREGLTAYRMLLLVLGIERGVQGGRRLNWIAGGCRR